VREGKEMRMLSYAVKKSEQRIAVLIPCYNEELCIGRVIADFQKELPNAEIHVFDNNSRDKTVEIALAAGATVSHEMRQGKGNVVKSMFQDVDADIYIMVDGDTTYPADLIHEMLEPVLKGKADMVVGSRLLAEDSEFKAVNRFGNTIYLMCVNFIFGSHLTDILSGYRVMTRNFVRNIPLFSEGFTIETELTIQALHHRMRIMEIPTKLSNRPDGSSSKIRIISDGAKILWTIFDLFRIYKPLTFFGGTGLLAVLIGIFLGLGVLAEYLKTGLVLRFPTAILATGLVLSGVLSMSVGLILNSLARKFREIHYQVTCMESRLTRVLTSIEVPENVR
jgi:glycosyltransferase involved in cell wall biosynthesis